MSELEAALREVAVLVAHGGAPEEVFASISEQAARVCSVGGAAVVRFGGSGSEVVGRWGNVVVGLSGALGLVRHTGLPARVEEVGAEVRESAAAPVVVEDAVWGALVIAAFDGERLPEDTEARLTGFAELASLALAGADARERLLASRARLVRTADEERKRLERNLHDGAQQRLVSARLALRMVHTRLAPEDAAQLDPILDELGLALEELRELARGLHPAALARGLAAAIGALATRSPLPVEYDVADERLPEALEVAAYYVVSEAITNAVKHAGATALRVDVRVDDGTLVLEVADDGRGGASFGEGSGLVGLRDRVEALRGRLRITSRAGTGTTLHAEFPLAPDTIRPA